MTDCITGNCTIKNGATTNGTFHVAGYDASYSVPYWHQDMELATICVANSLTFLIMVSRIWYRWSKLKRLKWDDRWIFVTAVIMIPYTFCQIMTNRYGGGLHMVNVHLSWLEPHWRYETGWAGYYIITSLVKISVCLSFLEILPHHMKWERCVVHAVWILSASLGTTLTFSWIFQCTPFLSNFVWNVDATSCINYDIMRWLWVGLSIIIDMTLLRIPWKLLGTVFLQDYERRVLKIVFSATLLGTIACVLGIWGVYEDRTANQIDSYFEETIFLMLNDIEIFMYTLGASFPVLSRYFVARAASRHPILQSPNSNFSTWARHVPDFLFQSRVQNTRHETDDNTVIDQAQEQPSLRDRYPSKDEESGAGTDFESEASQTKTASQAEYNRDE